MPKVMCLSTAQFCQFCASNCLKAGNILMFNSCFVGWTEGGYVSSTMLSDIYLCRPRPHVCVTYLVRISGWLINGIRKLKVSDRNNDLKWDEGYQCILKFYHRPVRQRRLFFGTAMESFWLPDYLVERKDDQQRLLLRHYY